MIDQASTLRKIFEQKRNAETPTGNSRCEIIAVTSGKGGVGKSNVSMNLSLALAEAGAKVLILDADIGTANIDILLNIDPRHHLGHVALGTAPLFGVIEKITENLYLIPGASGVSEIAELPNDKIERLRDDMQKINNMFNYLIVDTSAGVSDQVIKLLLGSDRILLVCNEEPTSIVDAYAMCKVLYARNPEIVVELIANNVGSEKEAGEVYDKLKLAIKHFLNQELQYLSHVVHDEGIARGVINQKPLMMNPTEQGAVLNFRAIAAKLAHPPDWASGRGVHQFFNLLFEK